MKPRPQCSTLFPYTTLFRSVIKQWLQWLKTDRMGEFTWDTMVKTYRLAGRVNWLKPLAVPLLVVLAQPRYGKEDRKSTRLNSSHVAISYAVSCLKKKTNYDT